MNTVEKQILRKYLILLHALGFVAVYLFIGKPRCEKKYVYTNKGKEKSYLFEFPCNNTLITVYATDNTNTGNIYYIYFLNICTRHRYRDGRYVRRLKILQ